MPDLTPLSTLSALLAAREDDNVDAAIKCYELSATVVLEPGKSASGLPAIREFVERTMRLPITFGRREILESGDTALHVSQWVLRPPGAPEITGRTADVLRRQSDGSWLLVIDNPWGTSLLDRFAA